jgi:hypothetical protein
MEINGFWLNDTLSPLAVTVNNAQYTGIIPPGRSSEPMRMQLDEMMMLNVLITNETLACNPRLLWLGEGLESVQILQQARRNMGWENVHVESPILPIYIFHLAMTADGLLIVGTVELVEEGVLA